MNYLMVIILMMNIGFWQPRSQAESKAQPSKIIKLEGADFRRAPPSLALGANREMYVAYRDLGDKNTSSSVWIVVFDVVTGRELRRAQFKAPGIELSQPATELMLSPDGSLLLYAELEGGHFMATVDTASLQLASMKEYPGYYSNEGFGSDGKSVLTISKVTDEEIEVTAFDARDLSRVIKKNVVPRPKNKDNAVFVDDTGAVWFGLEDSLVFYTLAQYEAGEDKAKRMISTDGHAGFGYVLFLHNGAVLAFTAELDSRENPFGRILRFNKTSEHATGVQRINGCQFVYVFTRSYLTLDQRFAIAHCRRESQSELSFGATLASNLVVVDTQTLSVLTTIRTNGKWTNFAVGHSGGNVFVANSDATDQIRIYTFADH